MPPIDCEVLLPVHNEAASIERTVSAIYAELCRLVNPAFIICEDGSTDNTKQVLRSLSGKYPMRLTLSDARKGYSRAMREGMDMLNAEYLLCLDSDGQCDPADFAQFWRMRDSADVIIGRRVYRADPLFRRMFSRFFFLIYQAVFRTPVHDPSCPFVLLRKEVARTIGPQLGAMQEGFWWEFVARVHRRRFRLHELPVHHRTRAAGVTQVYKWRRMPSIFCRHISALGTIWRETRRLTRTDAVR